MPEAAAGSPWLSASLSPIVLSGQDVSYLDAFRFHVVDDFNSWLTPGFWDSIVMRESMEDETIRHSILGLAAMTWVGRFTKEQSDEAVRNPDAALSGCRDGKSNSEHHQAALSHYARAISSCRQSLATSSAAVRGHYLKRLLISTIVFIIIEMMQGNIKAAINLVNNGSQLIQDAALQNGTGQTDSELAMVKMIFSRFSIIGGLSPCFPGSKGAVVNISALHRVTVPAPSTSAGTILDVWNQSFQPLQPFMLKSAFGHHITEEDLRDFSQKVGFGTEDLLQWQALVETHLGKLQDGKTWRSLILTKIQVLVTKIHLTYRQNLIDSSYDAHIRDFEEIVELSDKFTDSELTGRMRFTVDFNLFPWLGFTIARCRNRLIRKRALATFVRLVFRQGGWGNLGLIKALKAVVDIEDQWTNDDGHGVTGYSWTLSHWDFERRKLWVRFDPASNSPQNFMLMREVAVDY